FIGFISIHKLENNPDGPYRGFFQFFDWNAKRPGENSTFPGYDDIGDHATGGIVDIDGVPTAAILLVNSSEPVQAAYAVLVPRAIEDGIRDTFRLTSTI